MPGELDMATALASLTRIADTLDGIRDDLRRRSARDLEQSGAIPPGSAARAAGGNGGGGGARFGNYGRSKGQPVTGASLQDLEYYAGGCRRTLDDPSKGRFHASEQALLTAIDAEIARQSGQSAPPASDFGPGDEDIPF